MLKIPFKSHLHVEVPNLTSHEYGELLEFAECDTKFS